MQKIEINTTQNVRIDFEVASLRERIMAFFIDFLIMSISIILLIISSMGFAGDYFYYLITIPVFLFYTLLFEMLNNGQTPGKKAVDLKVVKLNGSEPRSGDYVLRWTFRMIDIYFSLGALASIFIGSSNKNQRLGDMAAETTIIRIKPAKALRFSDIIRINSMDNYAPKFPEVKKLSESNMLLVKNVIERYKEFPNEAHREALHMLVSKIKDELSIDQGKLRDIEFLNTLINDYVVLTR